MRVVCLKQHPYKYSCSSYLILGDWNRIEDVNTLVDGGIDGFILEEISKLSTGVGKKAVEQIVLTHSHFDHCAGVKFVKKDILAQYSRLPRGMLLIIRFLTAK